ncbi:MAG: hypothetical protein IJD35_05855 [Clostridia bacterium]|nr:hypothetical protein [Clostridia bacterium]
MSKICYQLVTDPREHTAEFTDTRRKIPLVKVWGDRPEDLATVYRAAASHFLELAHLSEHAAEFAPPEYSESERRAQFDRLTEENPVSIFEGVSL